MVCIICCCFYMYPNPSSLLGIKKESTSLHSEFLRNSQPVSVFKEGVAVSAVIKADFHFCYHHEVCFQVLEMHSPYAQALELQLVTLK